MAEAEQSKQKKSTMVGIIVGVLILAAAGSLWWWLSVRNVVATDNAKVAGDMIDVSPEVSGKLVKLYVTDGQQVKAGQILAKLDDSQYKINLAQAQAALSLAQANYSKLPDDIKAAATTVDQSSNTVDASAAQLQSAQTALADAKRGLDHTKALLAEQAVSQESMDSAQSAYDKANSEVARLNAVVKSNQASLANAQAKLDALNNSQAEVYLAGIKQAQATCDSAKRAENKTTITADRTGTILRIPAVEGETVAAGQTLLTICNLADVWINVNVDEKQAGRVKTGQKAEVRLDNCPGMVFHGTVSEVGEATQATFSLISTESTSGNYTKVAQRLPVKIRVQSQGYVLKPGLSATVKIHVN